MMKTTRTLRKRGVLLSIGIAIVFSVALGAGYIGAFPVIETIEAASGSVDWEVKTSHPFVAQNSDGELTVHIKAWGSDTPTMSVRQPMNLMLVIDRSGSMSEKGKLEYAKLAAKRIVEGLLPSDRIGIVAYSNRAQLLYPLQAVSDIQRVRGVIDSLTPTEATNLAAGLKMGIDQLAHMRRDGHLNRVVLLSDGLANRGITDPASLGRLAMRAPRIGAAITTMGLGLQFDENLLMSLAEHGAGNYHFIESPEQVVSVFKREFRELASTVARNPVLELELNPGVELEEVYGYKYSRSGRKVTIRTGDFYNAQERNITLRLRVPTKSPGTHPLLTASLSFEDALRDSRRTKLSHGLEYECTPDERIVAESRDEDVLSREVSSRAAANLMKAATEYESGREDEAVLTLTDAMEELSVLNKTDAATQATNEQEKELRGYLHIMEKKAPAPKSAMGLQLLKSSKSRARDMQK